jgi:hypothetical protein
MIIPGSANPLLLAGGASAGFQVSRSLRFNSADSAYLNRTPSVAGNRKTWTWSGWIKRSKVDSQHMFFRGGTTLTDTGIFNFQFLSTGQIRCDSETEEYLRTTQVFRDPSAWYHIVIAFDVTQGTNANKLKLYVNGSEITAYSIDVRSSLSNQNYGVNQAQGHVIGGEPMGSSRYLDGYLAEVFFIDGQALTPSSFTEVSATTGQLIPKAYTGTYGTNGFYLQFADNSSNTASTLGKDTSGNGNNWTPVNFQVSGTPTYSNYLTSTYTLTNAAYAFDGDYATYAQDWNGIYNANYSYELTFTPPTPIPYNSLVEVYTIGGPQAPYYNRFLINTGSGYGSEIPAVQTGWATLASGSGSISGIKTRSSQNGCYIGAIRIDGTILVQSPPSGIDSTVDTPTSISATDTGVGGEVRGNYCTWNPLDNNGIVLSNGNLDVANGSAHEAVRATFKFPLSGKWYCECTQASFTSGGNVFAFGVAWSTSSVPPGWNGSGVIYVAVNSTNRIINVNGGDVSNVAATTANAVLQIAYDADSQKLWLGFNNSWYDGSYGLTGSPAAGTNPTRTSVTDIFPIGNFYEATGSANFGQRAFAYTAPSGFKALCDTNLPTPVVAKSSSVMDVALWTGNGATRSITGLGFSPDLVWIKGRASGPPTIQHVLQDTVRGSNNMLSSNVTSSEADFVQPPFWGYVSAFDSDGFTLTSGSGGISQVNSNGTPYVGWCWDAGTSTVTNTAGSITSQVRANATAGFSVVGWNYPIGSPVSTIGHGLGVKPAFIIIKARDNGTNWIIYHTSTGATKCFRFNTGAASTEGDAFNNTEPTSSVFTIGAGSWWGGGNMIAYCFAPVVGYSSFGSYTGNGSSDGPFVYTGFRPRWVMIKGSSFAGESWFIWDTSRNTYNQMGARLLANESLAENSDQVFGDILSNGFKLRNTWGGINGSGNTYIYACFAESPFQYARAR